VPKNAGGGHQGGGERIRRIQTSGVTGKKRTGRLPKKKFVILQKRRWFRWVVPRAGTKIGSAGGEIEQQGGKEHVAQGGRQPSENWIRPLNVVEVYLGGGTGQGRPRPVSSFGSRPSTGDRPARTFVGWGGEPETE